jgi:hypothetical protein
MAISNLLDCMLCGLRKQKTTKDENLPASRVHCYVEIEAKKPISSDSQGSISSASQYTAQDAPRILETKQLKLEEIVPRLNRAFVVASKGTYGFQDDTFPEMAQISRSYHLEQSYWIKSD